MSQLNDIAVIFRRFALRYNWDKMETAENMLDVLAPCQWGLPIEIQLDANGNEDYELTIAKELEYAYHILWNE